MVQIRLQPKAIGSGWFRNLHGWGHCPALCSSVVGNSFGHTFRLSTWGESHGAGIGVVVDGCPPRLALTVDDIQGDLDRRRPGQSRLTTQRGETDRAEILSGVFEGLTTGGPIAVLVRNEDARSGAYDHLRDLYRPSHADFTYEAKYGYRDCGGDRPAPPGRGRRNTGTRLGVAGPRHRRRRGPRDRDHRRRGG